MKVVSMKKIQTSIDKKKNAWKQLKLWECDNLCKLDWIISSLILMFLFVSCIQNDVVMTGNRSFLMYEHFWDFYEASYNQSNGYYANYLPSTFVAYAIWNLPLYLVGHIPEAILTNSFISNMWYKLLPVILYYATSHMMYLIGIQVGFGEKKARLCKFAFLVFPIGVFSQFIFSQYDIFTVFFMVLGLYCYMKGHILKFAVWFGVATTFKYQAVLYYLALLVLKEKKIRNWLKYTLVMVIPLLVEIIPNIGSDYFKKNVFGFSALNFTQKTFSLGMFNGINIIAALAAFVLVWAYQRRSRDEQDVFSWGMFFCVAISFALFGFSYWHPQWLLIIVPFLVLNILVNENGNMLVMITNIFMLAMYIFSSQTMVDESVLIRGIWKYILPSTEFAVRMWDIYMFHDEELLCTAMWVVLLVYVVFGHPRYHNRKGNVISKGLIWQIRAAFLFGVAAFVIPMGISAAAMLQGQIVLFDTSRNALEAGNVIAVDESSQVCQDIIADGSQISNIRIRISNREQSVSDNITVKIMDKETKTVIYENVVNTEGFTTNSGLYTFLDEDVAVEAGKTYVLKLTSQAPEGTGIGLYCVTAATDSEILERTDARAEAADSHLQMKVTGEK